MPPGKGSDEDGGQTVWADRQALVGAYEGARMRVPERDIGERTMAAGQA